MAAFLISYLDAPFMTVSRKFYASFTALYR